ncbi:MAG: helicase, partial [Bacteroidetes bacterium]|nr:helicase [Bacteroidota bacterium]
TLKELNQRYIPNFSPPDKDGYITLTTHNANALGINQSKLKKINNKSRTYTATIKDDFPAYSYPTELELVLKKDAQVMFVKNDSSHDKLYYNGKIGKITKIGEEIIYVKCPTDDSEIPVRPVEWENVKYSLDPVTKEIKENVVGSFTQYPLKLAWAITIHKSQGLTFEKAIIDANASFAHGQVYVALSRCKSFEGLVLSSPITMNSIKTDNTIADFSSDINNNPPGEQELHESKIKFQQSLLHELFDFKKVQNSYNFFKKILNDNNKIIDTAIINEFNNIETTAINEIYTIADKFKHQLEQLSIQNHLPEENQEIQERVKKASIYFSEKIDTILYIFTKNINIETDNKAVKKVINEALEFLQKEIFIKLSCIKSCINGFKTISYLRTKSNAEIDFKVSLKSLPENKVTYYKDIPHIELYKELKKWRDELATENDVAEYMVLPRKAMLELLTNLPTTLPQLECIKGIGKKKVKQFGEDIISIIYKYCVHYNIDKPQIEIKVKPKKDKNKLPDSKKLSLELFKAGKTIEEIASERNFATSTIEGHLAHYVSTGELDVSSFVSKEKMEIISEFFTNNKTTSLGAAKAFFKDKATYSELIFVMKYLGNQED